LVTENREVLAAMPMARERMAAATKPGERRKPRSAIVRSWRTVVSMKRVF